VSLAPGSRLGPYEVIAKIGAGGMGDVYRARDTRLDRLVAVKVLPLGVADNPLRQDRFEREARIISSLNNPHICTLYDVGHQDGTPYLVMELIDGQSLADRLARGALLLPQALEYAIQIAEALEAAHRRGIVHRDLKPANVMLTKAGVKLLDFGIAKMTASVATVSTTLTADGTLVGTLPYMAPEQLEGQGPDARTDVFAFGSVLYEMLTGKRAFEGESQASLIGAILTGSPPPFTTALPTVSPILDRIVRTCLAKNPDDRWQNAGDLGRGLRWVTELGPSPGSPTVVHRPSRERMAWGLASVFGLIGLLLVPPAVRSYRTTSPDSSRVVFDLGVPATDDPISFALSPDGQQLAFVAHGESNIDRLWVRPLGDHTARPLSGTEGASYPFWAPNSREVGFFADRKLKRVDVTGGGTEVVADAPSGRGGAWNQDDVIVFAPTAAGGLFRVHARGGTVARVTGVVAGQRMGPRWPQFLPDGRHFIFSLGLIAPEETRGIYLASLDAGEPRRVLPSESAAAYLSPGYLVLVRQELLVAVPFDGSRGVVTGEATRLAEGVGMDNALSRSAFSVATNGRLAYRAGAPAQRRQLVWLDRTGRLVGTVGPPDNVGAQGSPELSPDERRIALQSANQQSSNDVWLIDVMRGVGSRFTSEPGSDVAPVWSPDGQRVVFASSRHGVYDLFEKAANDTTAEKPLLVGADEKEPLSWSRDGRYLLYRTTGSNAGRDLWALPMLGEQKPFPVVRTPFDEDEGQISPDSNWVAYGSTESGRHEIYLDSFPHGGGRVRISTDGGSQVRWAPDGSELYYVTPDSHLMAVTLVQDHDRQSLKVGAARMLFQTRLATGANASGVKPQYAVARDGRFLMNIRVDDPRAVPLTIVLNGMEALVRR
jgi:serine/threonine protein kinase